MPRSAKTSVAPVFTPAPADFAAAFFTNLLPSDLQAFSATDRARMAASIWSLGLTRRPGETKLRLFNPSPDTHGWMVDHTVIEIVHDDMPFLVNSVTNALQNRGFGIHIVIHPILAMRRDGKGRALGLAANTQEGIAESFMHIQIDHCFDAALLRTIEDELRTVLHDVEAAVRDWPAMRKEMEAATLSAALPATSAATQENIGEIRAFLRWLIDNNFTFLGYRELELTQKSGDVTAIKVVPGKGLGVLRDDEARMFGGLRDLDKRANPALRKYVRQNHVLFVTKTHAISRVHRLLPMDAVFVRHFSKDGSVIREQLFVGLFTSKTYAQTPRDIPFMRHKIAHVVARMGFAPTSHDGRNLMHILNTYPHDELFQISEDELYAHAAGILQLQERARVALFARRDPFGRYVTCLIYVPRDRYDSVLRGRIQSFLESAYAGKAQAWHVRIDDSRLARAFVTIHLNLDSLNPNPAKLENDLRDLCRSWSDRLRDSLTAACGEAAALSLLQRYSDAFPVDYRDAVTPDQAVQDVRRLERLRAQPRFAADLSERSDGRLSLKLFQPDRPLLLSEALPAIENMGLKVDYMGGPYAVRFKDGTPALFIHEFVGTPALPMIADFARAKTAYEDTMTRVWSGDVENDPFNALTLRAGLGAEAIIVLRAFARYLRQLRIPYSHDMMAATLTQYPHIAQKLYALFYARHNPALKGKRETEMHAVEQTIASELNKVTGLEDDRIVRRYLNLVQTSLRTNFFQRDANGQAKPYLSIKFDSRAVDFMPLPRPLVEIFVYSPITEAVHLRGGRVARGGIRWSDRRDDFRAEILGLMKAQMVKNSVIVPVGSKGGFIVKRPSGDADKFQAEGIACYTIMMNGLLDITDNRVNGKIVPPANVVRHDQDDPYLVVAADKGTAKFSDIANNISRRYGFWLDDAFASGGSAGYDHKDMGITARGAWEAIKRHFRERGKDIQTTPFTCIGVGDMSGDVFGNGMLLSRHTLLIGAFDHRHIFCDPAPDTAQSFAARKRLFALPRSSWADYDRKLLSKGGGIFARTEKEIKISAEMKKAYGVTADVLAPTELIQAMLKADIELLYFGGIGTYVKASDETHDEVGDRSAEALRINGNEVRAKVIGEGANLGMTQRGRVEYALNGGRLNTDAIDNSAGVDTSDHEVNLKILLRRAINRKTLGFAARDKLLAGMTDDVGHLVLRDNYLQTQALSVAQASAVEHLPDHGRCIQILEKTGLLNRAVEFLPDDAEIAERRRLGRGLTRPELAVMMAYTKIWLYQKILDSDLPDDAALEQDVEAYFPQAVRKKFGADIAQHQLRREIAATVLTNDLVNHTSIRILQMMTERSDPISVARAFLLVRDSFALPRLWAQIEALDNKVDAATQTAMWLSLRTGLMLAMEKSLSDPKSLTRLSASIEANRKGLGELAQTMEPQPPVAVEVGVPAALAQQVALFPRLVKAMDVIALAVQHKMRVADMAFIFFAFEQRLGLDWLEHIQLTTTATPWQRKAVTSALHALAAHHHRLTAQLAGRAKTAKKTVTVETWAQQNAAALEAYDALLAEGRAAGEVDLAILTLANKGLGELSA